jgi:hypothetical protein
MILSSHGIIGSSIVQIAFDADYQAVLDYGTTQGYTLPSASQQLLQNQLVLDLKDGGIWDKLDTFGVFATDGSSDFALIDWKRLSQYTAVNSPTFTANQGFQGNGTSSYINTNYNASTSAVNVTLNNASRYFYLQNANGGGVFDGDIGNARNSMVIGLSNIQRIYSGVNALNSAFEYTSAAGFKSIHRTSSTNVELFNGTSQGSRTQTSSSLTNNQVILRSGASAYSLHAVGVYAIGSSLVLENTNFNNVVNTYINSL